MEPEPGKEEEEEEHEEEEESKETEKETEADYHRFEEQVKNNNFRVTKYALCYVVIVGQSIVGEY